MTCAQIALCTAAGSTSLRDVNYAVPSRLVDGCLTDTPVKLEAM